MGRLVFCFALSAGLLDCQQLPHRLFSTADGLVRNSVTRIRRDPRGPLWICTAEGLSLFDGARFMNYTVEDGLPDRRVHDLLIARDGAYRVATGAGFFRFHPRRSLRPEQNARPVYERVELASGAAHVLLEDSGGAIWVGAGKRLFRVHRTAQGNEVEEIALDPPRVSVMALHQDGRGRVWIGTQQGLYRWSELSRTAAPVYDAKDVGAIHTDSKGRLWIGHWGLTRLDPDADPVRAVEHLGFPPALANRVFAMAESKDGEMWIGGAGLARLRPGAEGPSRRPDTYEHSPVLGQQFIRAVEIDARGNLWAAAGHVGLARVSREGFSTYTEVDGLPSRSFAGLVESRRGNLLAISDGTGALNEFREGRFRTFLPRRPGANAAIGWGTGRVVQQDLDDGWWLATEQGLLHYGPAATLERLAGMTPREVVKAGHGLLSSVVLQVFVDSRGDLWVGTLGGAARRERSTGSWRSYESERLAGVSRSVEKFAEDHSGAVWAGLNDQGLLRFRAGGAAERITKGVPRGITGLFVDSSGRLWIASHRDGLGRMDHPEAGTPEIRIYGAPEGVSSSELYGVNEDLEGRIYVSGGKGVDRLNLKTGHIRHFTAEDGLPPGLVTQVLRDRDGAMWFAGISGLSRYEPRPDDHAPPGAPVFRSVGVSGVRHLVSDLGEASIRDITLKPGQTGMEIELGATWLGSERIRYQHRLEGASPAWSTPSETPLITLAGLSPGRFRLLVRTVDRGGFASAPASLEFEAIGPVWQRWWFRLMAAAAFLAAAMLMHRFRVQRLLEMERVRTRIAADLHDDIGASLSRVALLSEVAHRRAHDVETVRKHTGKIAAISRELVDSVSDIVWAISPQHESVTDLAQRMRAFAGDLLESKGIELRFEAESQKGVRLGTDARRQVYLIFKEALNNAARHSGATEVNVRLAVEGGWLRLMVADNGCGLTNGNGSGNGLRNMRRRVEAMHGTFQMEAEAGGVRLEVGLPRGRYPA